MVASEISQSELLMMMMMMMMMMINISNGKDIMGIQSVHTTITLQVCAELLYIALVHNENALDFRWCQGEFPRGTQQKDQREVSSWWFAVVLQGFTRDPKLKMESKNDCFQKESPLSGLHVQIPC